jgi:hypothetical protein
MFVLTKTLKNKKMNRNNIFFVFTLLWAISLTSCSSQKEQNLATPEPQLFGKWQAVSQYNGYVNGGDFQWHAINNGESIEFKNNGNYTQIDGSNPPCTGNFSWQPASQSIDLTVSCQMYPIKQKYSELNDNTLIIDMQGREGIIRLKYKKI